MELIVDLHLHSKFAYATSKDMNLESMYRWAKIKGINILGTGDFTHPQWFKEISEKLEPAEPGLYKLKDEFSHEIDKTLPATIRGNLMRFILTVEISNIYTRHNKVRKLHNCIVAPDIVTAAKLNFELSRTGNLKSDGRPILGMDSEELLRTCLKISDRILFFPAHIWTPWFAMFGSKSGFDSIEDAFGELTPEIKVIETGLSSDPFMNWRLSKLDGITLVSNSDAHSPAKMAREANILNCDPDYNKIIDAIRRGSSEFVGTIEFFPEEGKYHLDGHRICNFKCMPSQSRSLNNICPRCGKELTIGVQNRVSVLADRDDTYKPQNHKKVEYIIPLTEIISEIKSIKNAQSKGVINEFERLFTVLGSEFDILRKIPVDDIKNSGFIELAESVEKMRRKEVFIDPGFDGLYGVIKIHKNSSEKNIKRGQLSLNL